LKADVRLDHMWEHGPLYEEHIQSLVYSVSPKTPFYSAVTGKRLTGEGCLGPSYWRSNMENPVLFNSSLRSALGDQDERVVLVEIGPHPALKGPIGQILRDIGRTKDVHTGTLQRSLGCEESLFHLAGKLFQQGVYVDYSKVCPPGRFLRDLPRYSWKHDTIHWAEPRMAREWRFREHPPHELLGSRVFESASEPNWRNMLALEDVPWLSGHDVCGEIIFPAAGYISMVGEALRQVEGESTYTLRNIQVAAALVLENDKTAELSTSFKPVMLDASEKSSWWTFTVSSFDGTKWVRHCTGEARASVDKSVSLDAAPPAAPLPRKVDESNWYKVLSRVGFNYSGLFRGMQCISAATRENEAIATVPGQDSNGKFTMHPAVIDQCFQLFTVSAYRGLGRNCSQIAVPAFIEEIVVSPSTEDLHVTAGIHTIERGSFTGDLIAQAGGRKMLSLKGFKASALTSADATAEDVLLITETEWKPHSDFASLGDYMHPADTRTEEWPLLEELALLCILDHCEMLTITDNTPEHLPKFFDWMRAHVEDYRSGANAFVSKDLRLWELNGEQRHARIEQIVAKVSTSESAALSTAVHRLFQNAATIFTGETHPLHILLKDNVLAGIYAVGEVLDYAEAIQIIANTNPHLRILEVGAGTGGTTSTMLSMLRSPHGERLYSSYTFTDLSAGFFSAAKEKFADAEKINYAVLDITRDPAEQGFELGAYDLIIASNVSTVITCVEGKHQQLTCNVRLYMPLHLCKHPFVTYAACSAQKADYSYRSFAQVSRTAIVYVSFSCFGAH
jgi:acyl transferase domain-containing protein/phospholipid N-methyltransferase